MILPNLKEDLVIIAMDKTYNDHITFLKREFKLKTNKELFIDEKISGNVTLQNFMNNLWEFMENRTKELYDRLSLT